MGVAPTSGVSVGPSRSWTAIGRVGNTPTSRRRTDGTEKQGREHGEREHQMRGQDLAAGAVRKGSRARLPARRGDQGGRALGVQAARGGVATARVDVRRDLDALKMGMLQ
jgi:hypothetical protein